MRADSSRLEALTFQFEDHHTVIIPSSEVIELGVGCEDPESVSVLSLLVDLHSSVHVPDTKGLILRVGYQDLHPWME